MSELTKTDILIEAIEDLLFIDKNCKSRSQAEKLAKALVEKLDGQGMAIIVSDSYKKHVWNEAIAARDAQLADRFPMHCSFLRFDVSYPEPD